ncbi:MAG TPA: hypothetical protein IAA29_03170 [Candidatus Paenibacillus intestinavium]|nr:hypothetical protein [Candidatus Paenibacillus intestinavium]
MKDQNNCLPAPRKCYEASDVRGGMYVVGTRAPKLAMNSSVEADYATLA